MICQNPPYLKEYAGDPALIAAAEAACAEAGVRALTGKIATGDRFVGDAATKEAIAARCAPDCVEMEGAAVSQIAAKNGVPCVILRAMSDNADESGHEVLVVKKVSIAARTGMGWCNRIPAWGVRCYKNCSSRTRLSSSNCCSRCTSRLAPGAAPG